MTFVVHWGKKTYGKAFAIRFQPFAVGFISSDEASLS
jgi:hypothetical protein